MPPKPQNQTGQPDTSNAHHIDTTGLSVQEWEAIKAAYARDGWHYAPHLMVFLREPEGPETGDNDAL